MTRPMLLDVAMKMLVGVDGKWTVFDEAKKRKDRWKTRI